MEKKQKQVSIGKRLVMEYQRLEKPKTKELVIRTAQILGFAVTGAVIIRAVDTLFGLIPMLAV